MSECTGEPSGCAEGAFGSEEAGTHPRKGRLFVFCSLVCLNMLTPSPLHRSKRRKLRKRLVDRKNKSGHENAKWNSCGEESATIAAGEAEGAGPAEGATLIDVGLRRGGTVESVSESPRLAANSTPTCPRVPVAVATLHDRPVGRARARDRYPRLGRLLLVGSATQAGTEETETDTGTETSPDAAGR